MKPEKLFLVLFICMGVLLAMLYGRFELGGWEMERCQKMIFGTLVCVFVIIVVGVILIYIYECFQCDSDVYRIYVSDTGSIETQGDIHSFYVLNEMILYQKIQKRSSTAETTFSKKRLLKT